MQRLRRQVIFKFDVGYAIEETQREYRNVIAGCSAVALRDAQLGFYFGCRNRQHCLLAAGVDTPPAGD
jgi:hypothetical protein